MLEATLLSLGAGATGGIGGGRLQLPEDDLGLEPWSWKEVKFHHQVGILCMQNLDSAFLRRRGGYSFGRGGYK